MEENVTSTNWIMSFFKAFENASDGVERYLVLLRLFASVHIDDSTKPFFPTDIQFPIGFQDHVAELSKEDLVVTIPRQYVDAQSEQPVLYYDFLITYKGRLELARLERERREASWWHRIKACLWTAICFTAGALVSAFIGWLFR